MYQGVTATLEEKRKEKAKIHYQEEKTQLMRLWKQDQKKHKKPMEKKIDKHTQVFIKTHGLLA